MINFVFSVVELLDNVDTTHIVWNIDVFKIRLECTTVGRRQQFPVQFFFYLKLY